MDEPPLNLAMLLYTNALLGKRISRSCIRFLYEDVKVPL